MEEAFTPASPGNSSPSSPSHSSRSTPETSNALEALLPLPPPPEDPYLQDIREAHSEATRTVLPWSDPYLDTVPAPREPFLVEAPTLRLPDTSRGAEDFKTQTTQRLISEQEDKPAWQSSIKLSLGRFGQRPDLDLATKEPAVIWGPEKFEFREQGWCVKLTWNHAGSARSKEAGDRAGDWEYSLYWRRNLEPWVLHREGIQGFTEEVQLTERESVASYWFILRIEKPEDDMVATSPVLGPLIPPSAPDGVRQVIATEIAPGTIEVSWRPPNEWSWGEVTDYEVLLENERQQQALTVCRGTRVQITDVDPYHCYTVQVCAVNKLLGRGPYCAASFPVNIRHTALAALPIDGCPMQSWNDEEKAPIPAEERLWWLLDLVSCLSALLATMAFDMELAASTYSRVEDPLSMSLLLSIYLLSGALSTLAVDVVERLVPPFVTSFFAKLVYVVAAAMYHLQVHAQSGQPAMDFRGWGVEHSAMQWSLKASAEFPEHPGLRLSRQMSFLLCMRGIAGGCAASVKHLTLHVTLPSWAVSGERWLGVAVSVLHSKCAPLGFACIAALSRAGLDRADSPYMLARALAFVVLVSAFLGLLLGPHVRRPSAALALSQVSSRVMLRRCRSLCQAEVRRSIHTLLSGTKSSFTAEVRHRLQNWDGPNCAVWIWSGRSVLLLDDQSPLLGLKNACVLPTLVALLQRQMLGAEDEIIESMNCARSRALKHTAPEFSLQAQCIILDVLTVTATLGEPSGDLDFEQRRKRFLSQSTEEDSKELYSIADLYEAFAQISKVSHVAVPCELLATTYVVTRTSRRPWLTCLGCLNCCRAPMLEHRLAVDHAKRSLRTSAEHEHSKDASTPLFDHKATRRKEWRGACPRWADIAVYVEHRLVQAVDKKFDKLIHSLFCMTSGSSSMSDGRMDAERGAREFVIRYGTTAMEHREQFREFISQYESHIGNHFVPAKESIELSASDVHLAATFCNEAMLTIGMKKGRHAWIESSQKSSSEGNEALSLGYALSCLIQGIDTGAVSKHADVGLNYCAKELVRSAVKVLPRGHVGKEKMKQLNRRLPRVLEALLRLRFFGTQCWTARIAHDVYVLTLECCARCAGGLDSFEVHERLQITDFVHLDADSLLPVGRAHLFRPFETVRALCRCEPSAVHELCKALMAEVGIKSGNALATGILSLVEWLAAERADLHNRLTAAESIRATEGSSDDADPIRSDALMLQAASALGFPSLTELLTVVGSCNIIVLHFGMSFPCGDGVSQSLLPGPGVCLGSVLNLMQVVGQGPECANHMLDALADALMQHPRWQPLVDLVDRGMPCGFLGAIAARGGFAVPWAPTSQHDPDDVQVIAVLMEFYMRIVRSGCVPPPAPPVVAPVPDKEDCEAWILAYLGCHGDGLVGAEDAMLLIEAVTGEPCEARMYTQFCNQISRCPNVGITVEDAKALLKEISIEQQEKIYRDLELGPGNFGEGVIRRAHKQRQLLEKKVTAATLAAWSLSDTLGLWLTHFFGPRAAQVGLVLPDESAGGAASSNCCSCCCAGTVKRASASEIRGLLALQARPEELARSWRGAIECGVASLPAKARKPKSRKVLASLLAARHSPAGQRSQRILPYNARSQLLAVDQDLASPAPERAQRHFHNDLCHSRTEMCRGGLRRDESRNLATLRGERTRWLNLYALRIDLYTAPALIIVAILAIYEAGLLLLLPQFLITFDGLGSDAAAALAAGVLASHFLGQACGSWHQGRRVREVSTCPLPAPMKFVMIAIKGWETDSLAGSVITFLGGELQVLAWLRVPSPMSSVRCNEYRPSMLVVATLWLIATFLLGLCRPLAETALLLRPRYGHSDGYQKIPTLSVAFLWRTVAAALGLPLLLSYLDVEDDLPSGQIDKQSVDHGNPHWLWVFGYVLRPGCEHFGSLEAAMARLGRLVFWCWMLALTPWLVSALNTWPYMHPVRRALHYSPPPRIVGSGGPPISGHPVVGYLTRTCIAIKWPSPHSTRNLVYDAQVSISYGIWQPAKKLNIFWPSDRREPSCRIAISSIPPGDSVRLRVRCAPVDSLSNFQTAELDKEALIWGPWSTPSLIIRRPELAELRYFRPLFWLLFLPVSLVHTLLYSLPAAWLGKVVERKHQDCSLHIWRYALLVLIWPVVCIHIFFWEFPLWARRQTRNRLLCPVLIVPLSIVILPHMFLRLVHQLKVRFRKSRDVEELPYNAEYGPPFTLDLAKDRVKDIGALNSMSSNDIVFQTNMLMEAGFNDDFDPMLHQHASRVKLVSACTRVSLSVCTVGKDNIYIEAILYMCSDSDALDQCVGAVVIESSEAVLSQAPISQDESCLTPPSNSSRRNPGWLSLKRLLFERCLLLLSAEVSVDALTLATLSRQAAALGAVGLLLVLDGSTTAPPHDTPSLHLPLFCITNASAVKLQDQFARCGRNSMIAKHVLGNKQGKLASGVSLGGIALCADGQGAECVTASWNSNASWKSIREVHDRLALQYRKFLAEQNATEDQWTTCAVATSQSDSILVVLQFEDEDRDEFRLLGYARGAWQPVTLHSVLNLNTRKPRASFGYSPGEMTATVHKVCDACGSASKADARSCSRCGERLYDGRGDQMTCEETQVSADVARGLGKLTPVVAQLAKRNTTLSPKVQPRRLSVTAHAIKPLAAAGSPKASARHGQLETAEEQQASKAMPDLEIGAAPLTNQGLPAMTTAAHMHNFVERERDTSTNALVSAGAPDISREPTEHGFEFDHSASCLSHRLSAPPAAASSPLVGCSTWLAAGVTASRASRPQRYNNIDWLG